MFKLLFILIMAGSQPVHGVSVDKNQKPIIYPSKAACEADAKKKVPVLVASMAKQGLTLDVDYKFGWACKEDGIPA